MRNKPALTASDVQQMAAACRAEAEKNKWNVTVAIVDDVYQNECVGAIGVSGVQSQQDEQIAKAGAAVVGG